VISDAEKKLRDTLSLNNSGFGLKNYSVKAGAGGGKTTLLSSRISKQIADGTPIEAFAIITYTNAAAAELRDRISTKLSQIVATETDDARRENARRALEKIELIQISTIHAFLLKILRKYSLESGIVLDSRMIDEVEDAARKDKFFNEWYRDNYEEIKTYSGDEWLIHIDSTNKDEYHTREVFYNMFVSVANVREEVVYDITDHTADFERLASEYIDKWLPQLSAYRLAVIANWPKTQTGADKKCVTATHTIVDNIFTVESSAVKGLNEALLLSDAIKELRDIVQSNSSVYGRSDDDSTSRNLIPEFPEWELDCSFRSLYEGFLVKAKRGAKVAAYVDRMRKEYQKMIDSETLFLSNDDILYRADRLFSEHEDILNELRQTYSKIYVDEFQDTTGLQARIVKMLSEKPNTDPDDNDLADDKLIVVGDPKQSIYRFTGAEKTVYDETDSLMRTLPDAIAESVSLDTNFRSNDAIVNWVNERFRLLMGSDYSTMNPDKTTITSSALQGVYKYVSTVENYKKAEDVEAVISLIEELVSNDHCFIEEAVRKPDGSFDPPILRRIEYSDIMILTKKTTKIDNYVKAFANKGIPLNVQGKFKVSDSEVLKNFIILIKYVSNPKSKKNRIAADQVCGGYDSTVIDVARLKKAEDELMELRNEYRNDRDSSALARKLASREELFLPKGKDMSVEAVREYKINLNQMIETCLLNNDGDLSKLIELMEKYLLADISREIPLESNENAVRLMNVHKAKGLEEKIVIIADRSNEEECRYGGFKKAGKYYPSVRYTKSSGKNNYTTEIIEPTYGWNLDLLRTAYEEETKEAIRLQYVAATRAANALIIMPVVKGKGFPNAWFSDKRYRYDALPSINQWIDDRKADANVYQHASSTSGTAGGYVTLNDLAANLKKAKIDKLTKSSVVSITPSGLEPGRSTGLASGMAGYVREARPEGEVFGDVMHRVYELIFMRHEFICKLIDAEREKAIEVIINQAVLEFKEDIEARRKESPEDYCRYLHSVFSASGTDYFKKVILPIVSEACDIYPEYVFSFYIDAKDRSAFISQFGTYCSGAKNPIVIGDGQSIWINGKSDLVIKKKDGSVKVYDYKSDAKNGMQDIVFESNLNIKYEGQLELYKLAIGKAFGVDPSDVQTELIHLYRT